MKNILFFGDSLTAGYGLSNPSLESLPALLQSKINEQKLDYKIINAGVSGDTSAGGLNRVDLFLYQPVEIFILELGANDILRGIQPFVTESNLQKIIAKVTIKYPGAKLMLLGMDLPPFIGGGMVNAFRSMFKKVATDNRMEFIPFLLDGVLGIRHLNLQDGFHPSANGYKVIAEKVWPVLEKLL
ncbi:arylesterase [Pedobacter sp. HMF7647]|uniref:Arylesterase n=1 Tax=Hufsiella arboris TaxID=2695275 RepID=A0A7K1Y6G0_9SPHI|nr:arylesterase [Hufsiella arboris]MXV50166.1 arylesterase [Hufsiella arboris]